ERGQVDELGAVLHEVEVEHLLACHKVVFFGRDSTGCKFGFNADFPEGDSWIHEIWSSDRTDAESSSPATRICSHAEFKRQPSPVFRPQPSAAALVDHGI